MHYRTIARLTATTALATATILALPAHAQDVDPAPVQTSADTDQIIVTGTRIVRPDLDLPSPVVSVSEEAIAQSGQTNITELLAQSPALYNSETNYDAAGSQARFGGAGVNVLNLRNLGAQRTLVLVDGRRHIAGVPGESAVDINTIPISLISRVDVLTGGASAVYGADGVSGVVNFVMKDDFEGLEFRGQQGISDFGDAEETFLSGTAGTNFGGGRGNFAVSYEYRRQGRVGFEDRPVGKANAPRLVRNPDDIPDDPNIPDYVFLNNITYYDSSPDGAVVVAYTPDFDLPPDFRGGGQPYDRGTFLPQSGFLGVGGSSTPIAAYQGDLQAKTNSHIVNAFTHFEISPALRLFAEGKYLHSSAFTIAQPSFDFYNFVQADNAFLPQSIRDAVASYGNIADFYGVDGVLVSRDNFDLGTRNERVKRDLYRAVIGADGDISDNARYELSYVYGRNDTSFVLENYRFTDRFFAALDAVDDGTGRIVCRVDIDGSGVVDPFNFGGAPQTFAAGDGSCQPLNIFGEGVASQAALDFINVDLQNKYRIQQHVATGYITGDFGQFFTLPGGPVSFALGAEYRKEMSSFRPDPITKTPADIDPTTSVLADLALLGDEVGKFDVYEGFAELKVPLLADVPLAHRLEFGAALRLSDYSTVGSTTTWKVDGTYAPVRDVTFRATYSESVRAPNITELFAPTTGAFSRLSDPCSLNNLNNGTEFREANCAALLTGLGIDPATYDFDNSIEASATILGSATGNDNLGQEEARTWTAGVVLRPSFLPRLAVTADWYDIKLTNAINTASLQQTAEFCVDSASLDNVFCDAIVRSTETGFVEDYRLQPQNVAFFKTAGLDIGISYAVPVKDGNLSFSGTLGYLDKLEFLPANAGIVDNDRGEVGAPKWVGSADVTWFTPAFSLNYGLNYVGRQARFDSLDIANDPDTVEAKYLYFGSRITHDIRAQWNVEDEKMAFYVGANNFTNEQPEMGSANTPVSFRGRFMYAGFKIRSDKLGF